MKLSEMRETLAQRGIQLTKSLGQNFLHDGNQLRRIVEAAELNRTDKVLEIGPGLGPLTELLLERAGEVLAIEKDARLLAVLRERFDVTPAFSQSPPLHELPLTPSLSPSDGERMAARLGERTQVHGSDARHKPEGGAAKEPETDWKPVPLHLRHADALEVLRGELYDWSDWKLIANLPYSVASPILVELALSPKRPERMVVTLQLEVARRLMAQAGDPDYGVLTLLVQLHYEPRGWFKIPARCFFPAPDVDSVCVILVRRATPLLAEEHHKAFVKVVKRAFAQRRKMMVKLLKADWPEARLAEALARLSLSPQTRAERVSLEMFVEMTKHLGRAKWAEKTFSMSSTNATR